MPPAGVPPAPHGLAFANLGDQAMGPASWRKFRNASNRVLCPVSQPRNFVAPGDASNETMTNRAARAELGHPGEGAHDRGQVRGRGPVRPRRPRRGPLGDAPRARSSRRHQGALAGVGGRRRSGRGASCAKGARPRASRASTWCASSTSGRSIAARPIWCSSTSKGHNLEDVVTNWGPVRGSDRDRLGPSGRRGDRRGPRARHRAPRPQAREPLSHAARRRQRVHQGHRLRPLEADAILGCAASRKITLPDRRDGVAALHGARAAAGRLQRRRARGHLGARGGLVRTHHRAAALRRRRPSPRSARRC